MTSKKYALRFNNQEMQRLYERLIQQGYHWKTAEAKVVKIYNEHGY